MSQVLSVLIKSKSHQLIGPVNIFLNCHTLFMFYHFLMLKIINIFYFEDFYETRTLVFYYWHLKGNYKINFTWQLIAFRLIIFGDYCKLQNYKNIIISS